MLDIVRFRCLRCVNSYTWNVGQAMSPLLLLTPLLSSWDSRLRFRNPCYTRIMVNKVGICRRPKALRYRFLDSTGSCGIYQVESWQRDRRQFLLADYDWYLSVDTKYVESKNLVLAFYLLRLKLFLVQLSSSRVLLLRRASFSQIELDRSIVLQIELDRRILLVKSCWRKSCEFGTQKTKMSCCWIISKNRDRKVVTENRKPNRSEPKLSWLVVVSVRENKASRSCCSVEGQARAVGRIQFWNWMAVNHSINRWSRILIASIGLFDPTVGKKQGWTVSEAVVDCWSVGASPREGIDRHNSRSYYNCFSNKRMIKTKWLFLSFF